MAQPYPLAGLSTEPGRAAFIITLISILIVTLVLALRVWAGILSRRVLKAHDYLYFVGYVFAVAYSAQFMYGIYPGVMGMHIQDATLLYPDRTVAAFKIFAGSTFIWSIATTVVKLALLSYYLRIFITKLFQVMAYCIAALSITFAISGLLLGSLICRPFAANWNQNIPGSHCGDTLKMELSTAIVNMILDFIIAILPLPVLWHLRIHWKKKAMLTCVFSLGLCICAMNITRIVIVVRQDTSDLTYAVSLIGLFSILEVNVGMICAGLPTLGPLIFRDRRRSGSAEGRVNTFMRQRLAGKGKSADSRPSDPTISTLNDDDVPLHSVVVGDETRRG